VSVDAVLSVLASVLLSVLAEASALPVYSVLVVISISFALLTVTGSG